LDHTPSKGLNKRLQDLQLSRVSDPREAVKVRYPLKVMLTALIVAMVTMSRSLRQVEERTGQIARNPEAGLEITQRIADNTFGKVLPRVKCREVVDCLNLSVKSEHRRGNLKPTVLPVGGDSHRR
jgi:hypothetical protein